MITSGNGVCAGLVGPLGLVWCEGRGLAGRGARGGGLAGQGGVRGAGSGLAA
jgi:hypothetical protein